MESYICELAVQLLVLTSKVQEELFGFKILWQNLMKVAEKSLFLAHAIVSVSKGVVIKGSREARGGNRQQVLIKEQLR